MVIPRWPIALEGTSRSPGASTRPRPFIAKESKPSRRASIFIACSPDHLKQQGMEAEWAQEIDKVISLYHAALRVKFDDWTQAHLAALYLERGRRDEAREQFRILIKMSQSS